MPYRPLSRIVTVFALLLAAAAPRAARAQSQAIDGIIEGVVREQSAGVALPGATVRTFNANTGAERTIVADASGRYTIPLLQPGEYVVFVEAQGFAPVSQANLQLRAGQVLTVPTIIQ